MKKKTLLNTTKRVAYLGTLAMGLLIALANCESTPAKNTGVTSTTDTTKNTGTTNTPPPYVGTYKVDSIQILDAGSIFGQAEYTGDVTVKDISAAGDILTVSGKSVKINASITIAAGNLTLPIPQLGIYIAAPVPADTTRGNLTRGTYTTSDFTATVTQISDDKIIIGGIDGGKFSPQAAGMTTTLYLTKK